MSTANIPHPVQVKRQLDRHVVGQDRAKVALAVAARNHFALLRDGDQHTADGVVVTKFSKPNTLVIGPTGCGKTYLLETLAGLLDVPFAIIDTTKLTESGYVGGKVEDALQTLWIKAGYDLEKAQRGIVYFDEFDKIARRADLITARDVSGEGVQKGLLTLLGGAKIRVPCKGAGGPKPEVEFIEFDTSKVLFVCGGAFVGLERIIEKRVRGTSSIGFGAKLAPPEENRHKVFALLLQVTDDDLVQFGLIPELVGRLPSRTALQPLTEEDLFRILREPQNSLIDQYCALLRGQVNLQFSEEACRLIAKEAASGGTGARALERIVAEVVRPTNLLLPAEKLIEAADVRDRHDLLMQAILSISVAETAPVVQSQGSNGVMTVGAGDCEGIKPSIVTALPVPGGAWQVFERVNKQFEVLRLMRDAYNRSFWVVRQCFHTNCDACNSKGVDRWAEWYVPYRRGVNPIKALGGSVPMRWYCDNPDCRRLSNGSLKLADNLWKPED